MPWSLNSSALAVLWQLLVLCRMQDIESAIVSSSCSYHWLSSR